MSATHTPNPAGADRPHPADLLVDVLLQLPEFGLLPLVETVEPLGDRQEHLRDASDDRLVLADLAPEVGRVASA